ncbi:MAG: hypothetical protein GX334_02795 [Firmicutes bacterium]|nr:hypothetical protein [Bacillota bacterium]
MDFDKWLQRFVTGTEKFIFRIALSFVVLLFVVQAMLLNSDLRTLLSKTDQLEGQPLAEAQDVIGRKMAVGIPPYSHEQVEEIVLELALLPPPGVSPELSLLLNNEIVGSFREGHNLKICVQPGDLLEVLGEVSGDVPATIKVVAVNGDLEAPKKGFEIKTFGERELLAWIIP